jgi:quercetin dioxygenase-like cupin family protein
MDASDTFFNLDDREIGIGRALAPGIETRIVVGDQSMLSIVEFEPNSRGSIHYHTEEQWGIMLEGSGTRIQDGTETAVRQGDFWRTPGGTSHGFVAGPEGAKVIDVFAPPREDYRTAGSGFRA